MPDSLLGIYALYGSTLIAAVLSAPALAFLGVHLATRDRALQSLCVGQGAVGGVLLGLGLDSYLFLHEHIADDTYLPLVSGLAVATLSWVVANRLVRTKASSKNSYFAALFALLVAFGHFMSALFPNVENHMAQVYFGDLVTLTHTQALGVSIASAALLAFFIACQRVLFRNTVDAALFGRCLDGGARTMEWFFGLITLLVLPLAVQYLGFLYTVSLLFLPTSILSYSPLGSYRSHWWQCALVGGLGSGIGFVLSLSFTRLPTVPAISASILVLGFVLLGGARAYGAIARKPLQYRAPGFDGTLS